MRKISEVLRLKFQLKLSHREIGQSQNISPGTVGEYLSRAKAAGIAWPLPEGMDEEALYAILYKPVKNQNSFRPRPNFEYIHQELRRKGVTLLLLWREYREQHANGLGYTRFCIEYAGYSKQFSPVMRQIYKGGEKCFVDYAGMTVPWICHQTGEIHAAQVFVGSLGASNFTFTEATATQTLPDWFGSHVRMFEYFGGVPQVLVPDNLKSGVKKAHHYDPDINPNFQLLGEHYGIAIVPARAVKPRDKAKVEASVKFVEMQILAPLRNRTFTSVAEINAAIKPLLKEFNERNFQKLSGTRRSQFEILDKPALKPLPPERFEHSNWKKARVNIDYHVAFEKHNYSVPYHFIHQEIYVRATNKIVECFYKGKQIAIHERSNKQHAYSTLKAHMPRNHQEQAEWTPDRLKFWATKTGKFTKEFIEHLIASRSFPEQAFRACLGVLRLGKRFGEDRLEKACERALMMGADRYQQIESILKRGLDKLPLNENDNKEFLPSNHENVRGSAYYD
jgi:transposase